MAELPKLYCVIPFRQAGTQVEFCLVRPLPTMAHWDFPKTQVLDGECGRSAVLREVEATLGLIGLLEWEALGEYRDSRGSTLQSIVFLMRVENGHDESVRLTTPTRRWCLAEEVHARIRQKPLRRMVNEALRRMRQYSRGIDTRCADSYPAVSGIDPTSAEIDLV